VTKGCGERGACPCRLSRAARRPTTPSPRAPRSLQASREARSNQHTTIWRRPATQPLAVGGVPCSGATPRLETSQAITWRGAPRRPWATPADTRHRRPSPHPTVPRLHQERGRIQAALTEIAHEGRVGAVVPRGPLGHTRRRRAAVSASWGDGTAGWARRHPAAPARTAGAAPCTPDTRPATRACARPSGRFPFSLMPCPPLPFRLFVVDLGSHHSMKRQRLATSIRMARAACAGKRAWLWGAASGQARVSGRISV